MKQLTRELRIYLDGLVVLNSEAGAALEAYRQELPSGRPEHDMAEAALLLHNLSQEMRHLFISGDDEVGELERIIAAPQNGAELMDRLADRLREHEPRLEGWRVVKVLQLLAHAYRMVVPVIFRWYADHEGEGLHHFEDTRQRISEHIAALEAVGHPVAA